MIPANRLRPALWGWALISLLLLGGMFLVRTYGSTSSSRTYVVFLVNVMLVVSLQTFIGNSGIVSFGHVAFMGIGAYTTALVTILTTIKAAQLPDLPTALGKLLAAKGLTIAAEESCTGGLIAQSIENALRRVRKVERPPAGLLKNGTLDELVAFILDL